MISKIKIFLYILILFFIWLQTVYWATFNVSGSISTEQNQKVDNVTIDFINKKNNKSECKISAKNGNLSWSCNLSLDDIHRNYDVLFSWYNGNETYKTNIKWIVNNNTISVWSDIMNNVSVKIKAPQQQEKTAYLEIKWISQPVKIIVNGKEETYELNSKHKITSTNKRLEIKVPAYDIYNVYELVDWYNIVLDLTDIVRQKELKVDLVVHENDVKQLYQDIQQWTFSLVGNSNTDAKYRIDIKPEQVVKEWINTVIKWVCVLEYCPQFIPYNNSLYILDVDNGRYIESKKNNEVKEANASQTTNNNYFYVLLFAIIASIIIASFFLFRILRKKA